MNHERQDDFAEGQTVLQDSLMRVGVLGSENCPIPKETKLEEKCEEKREELRRWKG